MKEEILQPPEPHPVPPILTPSPPSAFPTVTNVRQDNDRYHPKPVIHVVATSQAQVSGSVCIFLMFLSPFIYSQCLYISILSSFYVRTKKWISSRISQSLVQTSRRVPQSRKINRRLRSQISISMTTTTTSCPPRRQSQNRAKARPPHRPSPQLLNVPVPPGSRGS